METESFTFPEEISVSGWNRNFTRNGYDNGFPVYRIEPYRFMGLFEITGATLKLIDDHWTIVMDKGLIRKNPEPNKLFGSWKNQGIYVSKIRKISLCPPWIF